MVIQHNIAALNSHRNLGINNAATNKNLEKLSSGFRINRAGDDAAGLAISEKMRGQIRGLAMAEQNTNNGISLIQTAEGGLNETHAILQRMRELAVQASNGTYQNEDRQQIALEVEALKSEIDRISSSTHYNKINLLDGTLDAKELDATTGKSISNTVSGATLALSAATVTALGIDLTEGTNQATLVISNTSGATTVGLQIGDKTYMLDRGTAAGTTGQFGYRTDPTDATTFVNVFQLTGYTAGDDINDAVVTVDITVTGGAVAVGTDYAVSTPANQLVFQIGANGTADQQVGMTMRNMSTSNLGGTTGLLANIDVTTRERANAAIKVVDDATNMVSSQRAELGALQNRLEHTLNNLGVTKENLTAAESTIRDVDMAKEMMEFTKNSILVQASQAMLAQANSLPQGVLSLLR